MQKAGEGKEREKGKIFIILLSGVFLLAAGFLAGAFYRSLEREIYRERTAYLVEISEQIVSTTDTISASQWNFASMYANRFRDVPIATVDELGAFTKQEEKTINQEGLALLAFDEEGNFYDSKGNKARWQGGEAIIDKDAPERQVEITTLPTATSTDDEMVFVLRMPEPVRLEEKELFLTHVAVVRNMSIFNEMLKIPSFHGKGENYIISDVGTRVYRGQMPDGIIGDVYNILKPLEEMKFLYGGSHEELRKAVSAGESCSLEFEDTGGECYYITTSPMKTNEWSLLSMVPSDVVSGGCSNS